MVAVGEAAHDQIHFAHAAMPGAEQKLAPAHVQSLARTCRSGHRSSPTPKARTGRAAADIASPTRNVRGVASAVAASHASTVQHGSAHAARHPQSPVRGAHQPARHRAEAGEALSPPARPRRRRRASSICCSICRPAPSTAARGRSCATSCPDTVVTVAVDRRPPPAAAAEPAARALSDLRQRRDRRSRS